MRPSLPKGLDPGPGRRPPNEDRLVRRLPAVPRREKSPGRLAATKPPAAGKRQDPDLSPERELAVSTRSVRPGWRAQTSVSRYSPQCQ